MKKCITFIAFAVCLFLTTSSFAQIRKIPAEVTEGLKEKYPMASNVEWRDKIRGFTVTFDLNDEKYLAHFTNEGIWESTETEISEQDIPEEVKASFEKSKYADWETGLIQKIELPESKIQYRVQVVKSELRKKNLYFSSEGKLLKDKMTI